VDNRIDRVTAEEGLNVFEISQITPDKTDGRTAAKRIGFPVGDYDFPPLFQGGLDQAPPDEPGAAGDEQSHVST
jgi:hypothetical protein